MNQHGIVTFGLLSSIASRRLSPATSALAVSISCLRIHLGLLHFQLRISGKSSPCLSMYSLCSMSLSCIVCFRSCRPRTS